MILSLAWLELHPTIRTSLIILSVESSGYLQMFTRLYTCVSRWLRGLSPCLLRVYNSIIERSLLPLGLNSSSRRSQYVWILYPLERVLLLPPSVAGVSFALE